MAKRRLQVIKVKDYGDEWVNRLAVICDRVDAMENDVERRATLHYVIDKYRHVIAPDGDRVI